MMANRCGISLVIVVAFFVELSACSQEVLQTVTLKPGWNAVYSSVSPNATASEIFESWPVHSVSAYSAQAFLTTERNTSQLTGEETPRGLFGVWMREEPALSTFQTLPADTVLVCFNTNSTVFTVQLSGTPMASRIAWHMSEIDNSMNYVGVRVSETVRASAYFAGADIGLSEYYKLCGLSESNPEILPVSFGSSSPKITDGDVLLIRSSKISDWSGPLFVAPASGISFGSTTSVSAFAIRNDSAEPSPVTIQFMPSGTMVFPELLWRDDAVVLKDHAGWSVLSNVLTRTLSTGETWTVQLALDRSKLGGTRETVGGILRIKDGGPGKMLVNIPVSAVNAKNADSHWPVGLWVASVTLNKVSRYVNDATRVDGLTAGGEMKLRLLLHVDTDGNTRLLQRVTLAGKKNQDGTYTQNLYAPRTSIPAGLDVSMRISCAALPVDLGILAPVFGEFRSQLGLTFTYRISATSPSNPFRHSLHPQFDGLKNDFATPAPDGDDFDNYVGSVKPELFGVEGSITLVWDKDAATAWNPEETLTGTCRWEYAGLRREGPIFADGTFSMTRIVKDAILNQ